MQVLYEGADLKLKVRNQGSISITPLTTDQFSELGDRLNFEREGSGKISQFRLNTGQITNIRFVEKR